jgi:hypothetical protein
MGRVVADKKNESDDGEVKKSGQLRLVNWRLAVHGKCGFDPCLRVLQGY